MCYNYTMKYVFTDEHKKNMSEARRRDWAKIPKELRSKRMKLVAKRPRKKNVVS